jgi:hypothetical protein
MIPSAIPTVTAIIATASILVFEPMIGNISLIEMPVSVAPGRHQTKTIHTLSLRLIDDRQFWVV